MSTFSVPVVRIGSVTKHPNADSLSVVQVDGENVVFRTGDFDEGDVAIYVPVDAVVPTTIPGTEFLGERPKDRRIRAKRLRGVYSEGLLLPYGTTTMALHPDLRVGRPTVFGRDMSAELGITKYEEPVPEAMGGSGGSVKSGGQTESPPQGAVVYDIEAYKKHKHLLVEGERVIITEKLHGTNFRAGYTNDKFYVGSRNNFWKNPFLPPTLRQKLSNMLFHISGHRLGKKYYAPKLNVYWETARDYGLASACAMYPDLMFYGEVFGQVQDLKYGATAGEKWLNIFDIYDLYEQCWLPWNDVARICEYAGLSTVPVLYDGPYSEAAIEPFVEGDSVVPGAKNIREGIVIKPADSREDIHFGRVILKWVSQAYKLRKGGTENH